MNFKRLLTYGKMAVGSYIMVRAIQDLAYDDGFIDGAVKMADDIKTEVLTWAEKDKSGAKED